MEEIKNQQLEETKEKKGKSLFYVIAVIVLVAIIGVGVYFILNSKTLIKEVLRLVDTLQKAKSAALLIIKR